MKVAFVGKGGSGKTTLAALFARYLAANDATVLAFDADINGHLLRAVGGRAEGKHLSDFGHQKEAVGEFLRGSNPRIAPGQFIATTPPGNGSRLVALHERSNAVFDHAQVIELNLRVMAAGSFRESQLGNSCFHSLLHTLQALMSHLVHDSKNEYFVVDMTAGADAFASGLFAQFDVIVLVVEPTEQSIGVYLQFKKYSAMLGVELPLIVIGNKIEDEDDMAFLRRQVGDDLKLWISRSGYVKRAEKGNFEPLAGLELENRRALGTLKALVDTMSKSWKLAQQVQEDLHRVQCANANKPALLPQIDPEFSLESAVSKLLAEKM